MRFRGRRQVVDHHIGRANDLLAAPITAPENLQDGVVGLRGIVALRKRLMPMRVKRLAYDFSTLDPVLAKQLLKLFQRDLNPLVKLRGIARCARGQRAFETVDDRQ